MKTPETPRYRITDTYTRELIARTADTPPAAAFVFGFLLATRRDPPTQDAIAASAPEDVPRAEIGAALAWLRQEMIVEVV